MIWGATAQAIMILLGYAAACVMAAVFATIALAGLGPDNLPTATAEVTALLLFALTLTLRIAFWALWPTAIAVALTEGLKLRGVVAHVIGGCVVGLVAALPVARAGGEPPGVSAEAITLCVASGAVGGFFYWLVAGRTAGLWLGMRLFEPNRR